MWLQLKTNVSRDSKVMKLLTFSLVFVFLQATLDG